MCFLSISMLRFGISEQDRPVCMSHKIAVEAALKSLNTVSLRQESKWLNGASYTISVSDIPRAVSILESLSFVSELDIVGRMIHSQVVIEESGKSSYSNTKINRDISEDSEVRHLEILRSAEVSRLEMPKHPRYAKNGKRNIELNQVELNYGDSADQLNRINVPAMHRLGYDGSGVVIAVLDTGFNRNHESLQPLTVIAAYDFVYNDTNVADEGPESGAMNHGTASWSNIGARFSGKLYGGSYAASFVLCKTEDVRSETSTEEDNFVRAIEYSEQYGADILSASLGYMGDWMKWSDLDGQHTIIARQGKRAVDLGMLFVVANGNAAARGIGTPADMNRILAVGALAPNNNLASFSSLGPTADGRIKPEVSAPGVNVKVAKWNDITGYAYLSGTSFATPLTAGAAGLLLQSHPEWTNMQLRDALMYSATPKPNSPDIQYGWGIVNTLAANSYTPLTSSASLCSLPYGNWNTTTSTCECTDQYYNSDCRTRKLPCKSWCPGLCATNGQCLCMDAGMYRCNRGTIAQSIRWTCDRLLYNDGQKCNCNCGLYDPDCDNTSLPIDGCFTSQALCQNNGNYSSCLFPPGAMPEPSTTAPVLSPSAPMITPTATEEPNDSPSPKKRSHYGIFSSIMLSILSLLVR
jgi:hypothetical protein